MKKILLLLIIIDLILFGLTKFDVQIPKISSWTNRPKQSSVTRSNSNKIASRTNSQNQNSYNRITSRSSYKLPASGSQFSGDGQVINILPDDNKGSRHQRFIIRLSASQTILIAHNIDIAPRIPSLRVGDTVSFKGVYERNSKGGVVHWTHHDPNGRHSAGWLKRNGQTFQ